MMIKKQINSKCKENADQHTQQMQSQKLCRWGKNYKYWRKMKNISTISKCSSTYCSLLEAPYLFGYLNIQPPVVNVQDVQYFVRVQLINDYFLLHPLSLVTLIWHLSAEIQQHPFAA